MALTRDKLERLMKFCTKNALIRMLEQPNRATTQSGRRRNNLLFEVIHAELENRGVTITPHAKYTTVEAFVVRNKNGLFNIIANNDGLFIWDCGISDGYSAVLTILVEGMTLIPPPDTIAPEWLEVPFELDKRSDTMDLKGVNVQEAVEYSSKYLGGE